METTVDLFSREFWSVVFLGVAVLTPISNARLRKWALCFVNAAFLGVLLGVRGGEVLGPWERAMPGLAPAISVLSPLLSGTGLVLGGVLLARAALEVLARVRSTLLALALLLALLAIFSIHKLPGEADALGAHRLGSILASIGFSYVALRTIEVFRAVHDGRHPPPDFPSLVNYLLPFHALAAGPIQAYDDFAGQPGVPPPLGVQGTLEAVERIVRGLFKKYVLATTIERLLLTGMRAGAPYSILEAQASFVWIYLDFSAYSDIALGIGRLAGVATPENFDNPFVSRNIIEFWTRWHISLSLFIRRNIFTPVQLALARRFPSNPLACASVAFTLSFVLCGLWHQYSARFLVWGALHGLALVATNAYKQLLLRKLGRRGLERYLESKVLRALATAATFEFGALATAIII